MRKLILILLAMAAATGVAAALAAGGKNSSHHASAVPQRRGVVRDDVTRVATALGLTGSTRAALAKAQLLGRQATRCLLAHGVTRGADGGIVDPAGAAAEACAAQIVANEAFLSSGEFAAVLRAAQPRFDAAERCFRRMSLVPAGTIVEPENVPPQLQQRLDKGQEACFRPDGLPR